MSQQHKDGVDATRARAPVAALVAAVVLGTGLLCAAAAEAAAPAAPGAVPVGPWSQAKVGSRITYRMSDPFTMPGKPAPSAVVTEEVTAVTDKLVTVRVTRKEDGKPDQTGQQDYPRYMSADQMKAFDRSVGKREGKAVTRKLAGATLKCEKRVAVEPGRSKGRGLSSTTILCADVPGWVLERSAHRESQPAPVVWFEMLDFRR